MASDSESPSRARTSGRRSGGTVFGGCRRAGSSAEQALGDRRRSRRRRRRTRRRASGSGLRDARHLADVLAGGGLDLLARRGGLEATELSDVSAHGPIVERGDPGGVQGRMNDMRSSDVVIVGGGIGGSALATALARDGLDVVMLEASVEYEDRVRGESMLPWGVAKRASSASNRRCSTRVRMSAGAWNHYDADVPAEVVEANPIPRRDHGARRRRTR